MDFDEKWLSDLGVKGDAATPLKQLVDIAYGQLEERVGYTLAAKLTPEQIDEFSAANESEADEGLAWLKRTLPTTKKSFSKNSRNYLKKIKNTEDKIGLILSWKED